MGLLRRAPNFTANIHWQNYQNTADYSRGATKLSELYRRVHGSGNEFMNWRLRNRTKGKRNLLTEKSGTTRANYNEIRYFIKLCLALIYCWENAERYGNFALSCT